MINVNVRFPNLSNSSRKEVVYTALPFAQGEWDGIASLVLRDENEEIVDAYIEPIGARWPDGSVRYAKMLSRITVDRNTTRLMRVSAGQQIDSKPFVLHQSITTALRETVLELRIKRNGIWSSTTFDTDLVLIEDNRMRKVFRSRPRMRDFIVDFKLYIASNQQVLRFELSITGSNPSNTYQIYDFEEILLVMNGEGYVHVRGAARRGVQIVSPYKTYRLMANDYFGDGQKQSWYGSLVTRLDTQNEEQMSNASAAAEYVMYGMSTDWGSKNAFASLNAIQQPDILNMPSYWMQLINQWRQYFGFINSPGGVWDDYILGLTQTPGQTGGQEDFGCLAMGSVIYMGAAELLDMIYFMATEETKRPGHYYELDANPVLSANHPNWVTWDGITHTNTVVSPDRLGKTEPNFGDTTHGWRGKDWEHHSSNLLSLASLMTGSYLLLDEVDTEIELYLAGHTLPSVKPGWSTNDRFPPRAFGRTHHALCNHYLLTNRTALVARMIARFNECVLPFWDGATRSPVQNWEHIRDDRVLGSTVDAWVAWNDSLGFVGTVALYNVTRNPAVKHFLVQWGLTILNYGWHADFEGSTLRNLSLGGGIRWQSNGAPLTEEEYHNPTSYTPVVGDIIIWGLPVLKVIQDNPVLFGQENSNKAALYTQSLREDHPPSLNTPFSEYGRWTAINLL